MLDSLDVTPASYPRLLFIVKSTAREFIDNSSIWVNWDVLIVQCTPAAEISY